MALFRSPHRLFRQTISKGVPERHPVTGDIIGWKVKRITAEFGTTGGQEQPFTNPETGETVMTADIRGGFYDTDAAAQQGEWTQDEHDLTDRVLRRVASERPDYIQEVVAVHVPAAAPWGTYDDLSDAGKIVAVAREVGMVPETIRYERENLQRADVIVPLQNILDGMDDEDQSRADPKMEIPADMLKEAPATGVTIGKAPETTDSGIVKGTPGLTLKPGQIVA